MSNFFDDIKVSQEQVDGVKSQTVSEGGSVWDAGIYSVVIDRAYVRKTDSGAKMFSVFMKNQDGAEVMYGTCVQSGDEKGNKSTYVDKAGKEKLLPGIEEVKRIFDAIKIKSPAGRLAKIEHFGNQIEVMAYPDMTGKKLTIGVRTEDNEYEGEIRVVNLFDAFLDVDGLNSDGENMLEKLKAKIEAAPHKKKKSKSASTAPAAEKAAAASTGWGS